MILIFEHRLCLYLITTYDHVTDVLCRGVDYLGDTRCGDF